MAAIGIETMSEITVIMNYDFYYYYYYSYYSYFSYSYHSYYYLHTNYYLMSLGEQQNNNNIIKHPTFRTSNPP